MAKNVEYVVEAIPAEGTSDWFTCAHDEFAIVLDGELEIHLVKLDDPRSLLADDTHGAVRVSDAPVGRRMGRMKLRGGHQALLPGGATYRFVVKQAGVILLQTLKGELTIEKRADVCEA